MPRAPPIPPLLARRIDRLALAAHAFHRFAHHPLCDRYAGELVSLGHRARVCRGCTLALLGAGAGVVAGWLSRPLALGLVAWLPPAVGLLLAVIPLGRSKLLRRFLPAFLLVAAVFHGPPTIAVSSVLVASMLLILYRRKGPDRVPCTSCPQRAFDVCAGFAPIVRRERAFRRLSGRWLVGSRAG
jgi:hypothetical protein